MRPRSGKFHRLVLLQLPLNLLVAELIRRLRLVVALLKSPLMVLGRDRRAGEDRRNDLARAGKVRVVGPSQYRQRRHNPCVALVRPLRQTHRFHLVLEALLRIRREPIDQPLPRTVHAMHYTVTGFSTFLTVHFGGVARAGIRPIRRRLIVHLLLVFHTVLWLVKSVRYHISDRVVRFGYFRLLLLCRTFFHVHVLLMLRVRRSRLEGYVGLLRRGTVVTGVLKLKSVLLKLGTLLCTLITFRFYRSISTVHTFKSN